jgi:hypothetical protein
LVGVGQPDGFAPGSLAQVQSGVGAADQVGHGAGRPHGAAPTVTVISRPVDERWVLLDLGA